MIVHKLALTQHRTVGYPHQAAHRHNGVILQHRADNIFQRILLQHTVRIHTDKIRVSGRIDTHIQGIRLTAVYLLDQSDIDPIDHSLVYILFLSAFDLPVNRPHHLFQMKGIQQYLGSRVL